MINEVIQLDATVETDELLFDGQIERDELEFDGYIDSSIAISQIDVYDGPYTVTPKIIGQTLETRDKKMARNVLVREIPYYETINVSGGNTVFIANSLED